MSWLVSETPEPTVEPRKDLDRPKTKPTECWLPERLRPAVRERFGGDAIFEEFRGGAGGDFYVPLQRLVSGELADRCKLYRLSARMRDLLRKGDAYLESTPPKDRFTHSLAMILKPAAARRIRAQLPPGQDIPDEMIFAAENCSGKGGNPRLVVPISINQILVYHFGTNRIVCQVGFEASLPANFTMTDVVLSELVDHAGRFADLGWIEMPNKVLRTETEDEKPRLIEIPRFSLGSLVARMLFGPGGEIQRSFRTFTHTYAQIGPDHPKMDASALKLFGTRIARQYTTDYALSEEIAGAIRVADFDNVHHYLAREGGATIVYPHTNGEPVAFLEDYANTALERSYLPILVLTLHQHTRMLELAARSVLSTPDPDVLIERTDELADAKIDVEKIDQDWRELQDGLVLLQSRFRFMQISQITMHNSFNKALRDCFDLDAMEAALSRDLAEMSERIRAGIARYNQLRASRFAERYGWIAKAITGVVAGIFFLEFVNAFVAMYDDQVLVWWERTLIALTPMVVAMGISWAHIRSQSQKR